MVESIRPQAELAPKRDALFCFGFAPLRRSGLSLSLFLRCRRQHQFHFLSIPLLFPHPIPVQRILPLPVRVVVFEAYWTHRKKQFKISNEVGSQKSNPPALNRLKGNRIKIQMRNDRMILLLLFLPFFHFLFLILSWIQNNNLFRPLFLLLNLRRPLRPPLLLRVPSIHPLLFSAVNFNRPMFFFISCKHWN